MYTQTERDAEGYRKIQPITMKTTGKVDAIAEMKELVLVLSGREAACRVHLRAATINLSAAQQRLGEHLAAVEDARRSEEVDDIIAEAEAVYAKYAAGHRDAGEFAKQLHASERPRDIVSLVFIMFRDRSSGHDDSQRWARTARRIASQRRLLTGTGRLARRARSRARKAISPAHLLARYEE